jgi:hypothetical protein
VVVKVVEMEADDAEVTVDPIPRPRYPMPIITKLLAAFARSLGPRKRKAMRIRRMDKKLWPASRSRNTATEISKELMVSDKRTGLTFALFSY